jgi:hypothetical protein
MDFLDEAKPSQLEFPQAVNWRRSGSPENGFELKVRVSCERNIHRRGTEFAEFGEFLNKELVYSAA